MVIKYTALFLCLSNLFLLNPSERTIQAHGDEFGNTELHYAMRRGVTAHPAERYRYIDAICALLYANVSLHQENADGLTASEFATCYDTADGYSLPLTKKEVELYSQGRFSALYGEWLKRAHSNKYALWTEAYEAFKKNKAPITHSATSSNPQESPPIIIHHKKVKSDDSDISYSTKRTASLPAIVVHYED